MSLQQQHLTGARQDASEDYPQSRGKIQVVCVFGSEIGGTGDWVKHRGKDQTTGQWPGALFGLRTTGGGLRPVARAAVRVRAALGDGGLLRVCVAAGGLSRVWGESGAGALGRRQESYDDDLSM